MKYPNYRFPASTLLMLLALLCAAGCATTIDTFVDYDKAANFQRYETFSWIDDHPLIAAPVAACAANPFMESRIQDAIQAQLTRRGYQFKPTG